MTALAKLEAFGEDGSVNVVVESPRGTSMKFKYDPDHDVMGVSRPLPIGMAYPFDWGFVPGTQAEDGDPLDVFILSDSDSAPGIVIPCRLIGIVKAEQKGTEGKGRVRNDRVAAVPIKAARQEALTSVFQIPERVRQEIEMFFYHAVAFEGKNLTLLGWGGPTEAERAVRDAMHTRKRK
jgi:inorganic pyrophosphatase